ncbi:MAG: ATP-binding protein [Gemmatimonadales bacterium]
MTAPTRSLPLERKLPLLILALLGIVVVVSVGISYYEVRRVAERASADRLASLSNVFAQLSEQSMNARLAQMRRIARVTSVAAALDDPSRPLSPAAQRALATLTLTPSDTALPAELLAPDGTPVGGAPRLVPAGDDQALRAAITRPPANGDSGYLTPLVPRGDRASVWVVAPVRRGGVAAGWLVQERRITANPQALRPLRALSGPDIEFYLHNLNDSTWVSLTGRTVASPVRAAPFDDSLQLLSFAAKDPVIASTTPVAGAPYAIVAARPVAAILGRPLATFRALAALALVLVVLGGVLGWAMSRRLTRPLVELTSAAEALAQGEYTKRVNAGGTDEIGRLATAFNRMASQVQDSSDSSAAALSRLTHAMDTQRFLADASRTLAGSFSDEKLLPELARLCVPRLADYCTIHIAGDDGSIRRAETVHYDPSKLEAVRALVRLYEYRVDGPGEVGQAIRTQQPVVMPRIRLDALRKTAPSDEAVRLLDEIHPTAFLCVPLVARGRAFGAISFTMTDSGRTFGDDDIALALELARRSAVAIDNALIYQRSIALRQEAEAASNAKSDFMAKMSHEIRTPINAMMGYAELLQMGISGAVSEIQAKQLARIRASGEHLTALVNEILDLAKIEAGSMALEPSVASAGEAAEAALALIRPQATTKGVELAPAVEGEPASRYVGDPQRVQQILTNLLSNAVKFTSAGGRVSICCGNGSPPPDIEGNGHHAWTWITVADTGVGIAGDDLDRIFQPFVQVDQGYTRAHGGTGLGLTISRNLAQMMGGEISVDSAVGHGSRFSLWLPAPLPAAPTSAAS